MLYLLQDSLLWPGEPGTEIGTFLRYEAQQNKQQLGYQTHLVDPQWAYLAHHPKVSSCVAQLLASQPMIVQTMYLPKPPLGTREVAHPGLALHQDSLFIRNEPNTLMACWLALDDTGGDNGGLCVVANSHRYGLQPAHHNQDAEEHVSSVQTYGMRDRNGQEWSEELYSFEMDNLEQMDIQHLSVPAGSSVFFTGLTIHGSYANRSLDRHRRAFAIHYVGQKTWVYRTDIQDLVAVNLSSMEA